MRTHWATVAVVVVVAAVVALVIRPPITDPATAHQLISMQRAVDKLNKTEVRVGPPSVTDIQDLLRNQGKDALALDAANTTKLKAILDAHGWPTEQQVGSEAVHAALSIVERSADTDFQAHAVDLMQQAKVKPDEVYARVIDMVEVAHGEPQTYGTQWQCVDGHARPITPVKDPEQALALRRQIGMPAYDKLAADFCAHPGGVRIIRRGP
ncbi:MAG TPA: DUF6624 domain-containing protein [Acidimicrobiales bacterium]|nr:DUF6624 domain-containing protein [Acidimicrobiales bacterium]